MNCILKLVSTFLVAFVLPQTVAFVPAFSNPRLSPTTSSFRHTNANHQVQHGHSMVVSSQVELPETKPRKTREVSTNVILMDSSCPCHPPAVLSLTIEFFWQERLAAASKGLQVHCVGLSIHHAQVEVREKLAIPEPEWNMASNEICASGDISEAAVLSTCNRFEVYYAASDARTAMASITKYLAQRSGLPVSVLRKNLFMLSGEDAVWHVMRVAGGLDSLIVGEGQILSQVRQCHLHSIEETGCGGKVLSRLLNNAVAAGKRVRSETAISKGSVSISSAAVELSEMMAVQDVKLPFPEARMSVIGAGKMTRLLITHLASRGLKKITIVNRSLERPMQLKEQFPDVDIEVKLMDDLWDVVGRSDIVYTATSSADYVIDKQKMEENDLANGRPMMIVDISVPRNVGEDCNSVSPIPRVF